MSSAARILDHSPDLLDPFAYDLPADPVNWSQDVTNGVSLAPPIGWQEGDGPVYVPGPGPEPWMSSLQLVAKNEKPRVSLRRHVEIVEAIATVIEQLDDEELTPEAVEDLGGQLTEAITGTKQKVDATCYVMAGLEHKVAAYKAERDRLAAGMKRFERQLERLNGYVLNVMEVAKTDQLDGETSSLKKRLNPQKVEIEPGVKFAHEFLRYPDAPPPEPDKDAIKKALLAKRQVAGAKLVRGVRLVRS